MIVVAACYGEAHRPFLGALLESLDGVHPAVVVHDGVPWLDRYPGARGVPVNPLVVAGDRPERVARKLRAWEIGFVWVPDGEAVAFLDADTVVFRPLLGALPPYVDVASTWRPGPWPLNTGVVFARASGRARAFVAAWRGVTDWALALPSRTTELAGRWGAVDQAGFVMARAAFSGKEPLAFNELACSVWNDSACPASRAARVRHYKGMLPFLLGERDFSEGDEHHGHDHAETFGRWRALYMRHLERVGAPAREG